ncbi:MAG: ATP-binding protein [Candidatus Krumholzibacteriota bacterium]|nr:ATP-binding protein [Candidatus Krumholzibacteriota bacterium]
MSTVPLHCLNLETGLRDEFFAGVCLPDSMRVRTYKTFRGLLQSLEKTEGEAPVVLLFLPVGDPVSKRTRELRLASFDSPIYVVTRSCSESDYLTYITLGVSGIFHPPFSHADVRGILQGRTFESLPFPRSRELIREGQIRLDFLVPSKLSRILGVNRLVSFLTSEFGFPPEESLVNLPLVMDEALSNAIRHGNRCRDDLKVRVRIYISSRRIVVQVEDQGEGFDHEAVADPRREGNIYKDSGRGIYLIRELMDLVSFERGGRVIKMEKRNPDAPA